MKKYRAHIAVMVLCVAAAFGIRTLLFSVNETLSAQFSDGSGPNLAVV